MKAAETPEAALWGERERTLGFTGAAVTVRLPQPVLDMAAWHGRYAGLGLRKPMIGLPHRAANVDSLSVQRA